MKQVINWIKKNKITALAGAAILAFIGWEYRNTLIAWKDKLKGLIGAALPAGAMSILGATTPTNNTGNSSLPRGLRNNNPGNIIQTNTEWKGEVRPSSDPVFKQFKSRAYGYRAIFKLLTNYINGGSNTIAKIINKWSPGAGEGNTQTGTDNYVTFVSKETGIDKNATVTTNPNTLLTIGKAISHFENGRPADAIEAMAGLKLLEEEPN